jgi:hypothetical protein
MVIGNKNDLVNQRKVVFSVMRSATTKGWSSARSWEPVSGKQAAKVDKT